MTMQLMSMQQAGGRQAAQIAVLRKQNEMEAAVVNMIDDATSKAPPPPAPGTGLVVDRQA